MTLYTLVTATFDDGRTIELELGSDVPAYFTAAQENVLREQHEAAARGHLLTHYGDTFTLEMGDTSPFSAHGESAHR